MSLHDIVTAANDLADLLEATAPKGLKHPRHAKHVRPARAAIKSVMVSFFARQRKALLAEVRPKIRRELVIYPPIREASQNGKTFARSVLPTSLHPLTFAATSTERDQYDEAITDLIASAARSIDASATTSYASQYLHENSLSKLTGELNATSIDRLQNALADAWDAGGDYNTMVAAIQDTFDDFSDKRADLIAQTEAADAYNAGRADTAAALGYNEKSWETESGEPCPVCEDNEAQEWIDIDEKFDNGDDAPTAHPNCLCVVNFRKSSESDDEE